MWVLHSNPIYSYSNFPMKIHPLPPHTSIPIPTNQRNYSPTLYSLAPSIYLLFTNTTTLISATIIITNTTTIIYITTIIIITITTIIAITFIIIII